MSKRASIERFYWSNSNLICLFSFPICHETIKHLSLIDKDSLFTNSSVSSLRLSPKDESCWGTLVNSFLSRY
jgi:hypothetical protein